MPVHSSSQARPGVGGFWVVGIMSIALHGCATIAASNELAPFTTDGCSLFFDRSPISGADWCRCCVVHDLAYWKGGNVEDRRRADQELRSCIAAAGGGESLAELVYGGVRLGGTPSLRTSFRWGYGWPYGRGYKELSPEELRRAAQLEAEYRKVNPELACPSPAHLPSTESP